MHRIFLTLTAVASLMMFGLVGCDKGAAKPEAPKTPEAAPPAPEAATPEAPKEPEKTPEATK